MCALDARPYDERQAQIHTERSPQASQAHMRHLHLKSDCYYTPPEV